MLIIIPLFSILSNLRILIFVSRSKLLEISLLILRFLFIISIIYGLLFLQFICVRHDTITTHFYIIIVISLAHHIGIIIFLPQSINFRFNANVILCIFYGLFRLILQVTMIGIYSLVIIIILPRGVMVWSNKRNGRHQSCSSASLWQYPATRRSICRSLCNNVILIVMRGVSSRSLR